jgi:hypothetical protein
MKQSTLVTGLVLIIVAGAIIGYISKDKPIHKEVSMKLPRIQPPVPDSDLPFDEYTLLPNEDKLIERSTGTQLSIPAGCFRKKDGSKPSESIRLKVREIHDPMTILQTGIPMEIAGTNGEHLQSAGMIEMHAYENGNELALNPGSYIGVELAAYRPSDGYSLYYLENNQSWKVSGTFENKENTRKKKRKAQLSEPLPVPDTLTNESFVFNIDADTSAQPQLIPFINQSWALVESVDQNRLSKALRQNWPNVEVEVVNERKMHYRIRFSAEFQDDKGSPLKSSFSVLATPVFKNEKNRRLNRKDFELKMNQYVYMENKRKEELNRLEEQANLLNAFKMEQMGVYNIDRILKEEMIITNVHFDFESSLGKFQKNQKVYMVLEEDNSVFGFERNQWDKMTIPANKKFQFVTVLPGSEIAYVGFEEIQSALMKNKKEVHLVSRRKAADAFLKKSISESVTGI